MKTINIILNNNKDIKKLNKKLRLYKSFIYKNIRFTITNNTDDTQYNNIITALNIKNRKKRIKYIYESVCKQIDDYNQKIGLNCNFINSQCLMQHGGRFYNGCCRICKYQSQTGCTTQNLSCKFFYCDKILEKYTPLKYRDIKMFKLLSRKSFFYILYNFFASKEQILGDLYIDSLIIFSIKLIIRVFSVEFHHYNKLNTLEQEAFKKYKLEKNKKSNKNNKKASNN